jgi:flavin reductase (DIM6/NTAB) family NADH-FMN oxidoreductase RutF
VGGEQSRVPSFEQIVGSLDYPMFVVSAMSAGAVAACLVGFTTQCSIDPPRFVVFLSKKNHTYEVARQAETLVVHRVRHDQEALAEHFGARSDKDDPGKLGQWPWHPGPDGIPVIDDCDWFAGHVIDRNDAGDHVGFVLAPFAGECRRDDQLGFQDVRGIDPGQPA